MLGRSPLPRPSLEGRHIVRKRYRKKRRSCALCKPNKMGGMKRWTARDEVLLKEFERRVHRGDLRE
jgi:hypothetical protein